jgi:predicted O-methyltransferase YrrM
MNKYEHALDAFAGAMASPLHMSSPAPWAGHTPFALWLMPVLSPRLFVELGAYSGISYLAFCQSIQAAALPTRCVAVDTWAGDEHAGFYSDVVYETLKLNHDHRYGHFSSLLRKKFDDAVGDFADQSIDLLHIDGLHTYEAVKHDFETWLPKLSSQAVVLFHDTAVRDGDFGVYRFWEEVTQSYPGFAFEHSHGLGVLFVGADSVTLWKSHGLPLSETGGVSQLRQFFSAVGAVQESRTALFAQAHELAELQSQHDQLKQASEQQHQWILKLDQDILHYERVVHQHEQVIHQHEQLIRDQESVIDEFHKNPILYLSKRLIRQLMKRFRHE